MDRKEFQRRLNENQIPSVLLFEGEEAYLKQEALESLRKKLLPAGLEELNESRLENPEPDELIAAAETLPMMADRRMVIVRDYPPLVGRSEVDSRVTEYLPKVPESTVLIFYCTRKPDGRKSLYTGVKRLGGIVTFAPMRDRELTSFVVNAFRDQGKECDERTADFLIFTCGNDTAQLLSEVGKIASRRADENSIRAEDIRELATPSVESTVFSMVDAVVAGQEQKAFSLLRKQLLSGENRVGMLAMLLREYRLLQQVKIMQYEKQSLQQIREALGVSPYTASQYIRQANSCTAGHVKRGVQLCLETEYAIKSGQMNQEGALEAVMLKLMTDRKAQRQ